MVHFGNFENIPKDQICIIATVPFSRVKNLFKWHGREYKKDQSGSLL